MKIQSTQDYPLFKRISGNRTLSQPHIKRLLEAIQDSPETITFNPIIVNDRMEVIDGQHRLEAIKKLNLPVHYVKVSDIGLDTVQKLNSVSKTWTPMDFAKSFAENGNDNYAVYIDFKNEFKLNHETLMRYLSQDYPSTTTSFKAGQFKVQNSAIAYVLCKQLLELSEYYERITYRNPSNGFYIVATSPLYNHDQMVRQFKVHGHRFQEQAFANDFARELERIYNFKQRETTRLF